MIGPASPDPSGVNFTETFLDRLLAIRPSKLDEQDLVQVRRLVLDLVGVSYGSAGKPWLAALRRWASTYAGQGLSPLIAGSMQVPATIAALVNGTAAHSFELDDTHDASLSHPGAVVIPAALAVAAEQSSSGMDFVLAVIAGYEAMTRMGMAANAGQVIHGGMHPTALFGVFGAATAAAFLYKLDRLQHLHSWGHALSLAGGSMQFSDELRGTTVKRLHAGYPAHNGIMAAQLARAGIDAPERSLDGKYGLLALYGKDPQPHILSDSHPRFAVHEISMKPYACCRQFHSAIDALQAVTDNFTLSSDISRITVRGPLLLEDQHMLRRPLSPMAAQYSLPFVIGATLEFGPVSLEPFEDKRLSDPRILRWADMVQFEHDADLDAIFPAHLGTEVEVELCGKVRRSRILDSLGTAANPLPWDAIVGKVQRLCAEVQPALDVVQLEGAIQALPEGGLAALNALLGQGQEAGRRRDVSSPG